MELRVEIRDLAETLDISDIFAAAIALPRHVSVTSSARVRQSG
jgi:hypothetical protein